jgi:hypothetical protein
MSVFFSIIPKCIDAFLSSWHECKNFVAAGMGLLHSHTYTNSHFRFLIIVELAVSQVLLQEPNK